MEKTLGKGKERKTRKGKERGRGGEKGKGRAFWDPQAE